MTLRDSHSSFCSEFIWLFSVFYSFLWISRLFPLFLVKNFVRMYWVCKLALATLSFHNINLNNLWTWKCFLFLCFSQILFVFYSLDFGSYLLFWLSLIGIWFWRALWVRLLYQFLSKPIVMHRKTNVFCLFELVIFLVAVWRQTLCNPRLLARWTILALRREICMVNSGEDTAHTLLRYYIH